MDRRAAYGAVRLLPRLTSVGMFLVIALQLGRLITPGIGFIDVLALGAIGVGARVLLQSGKLKPPT